ncbi:glycosyltransferase family 4 protein [Microbacterium aurum]
MAEDTRAVHFLLPGISSTPIGGYKVVYEYADEMARSGVSVTVWHCAAFSAFTGGRFRPVRAAVMAGGRVKQQLFRARTTIPWFAFSGPVSVRNTAFLPRPRLARGDLVVGTAYETIGYAARVARLGGARSVAFIQHFETWAAPEGRVLSAWGEADERVVIAPWLADLCTAARLSARLLPNALDTASFPKGPELIDRAPSVLTLLSPHGYKRPDTVAAVLGALAERRPGLQLDAFGPTPSPPVPLPPAVRYHPDPAPDHLRQLYRNAAVYLCGSEAEGWHLPPAEATLSGAAVVSTDIGGVRASMQDDALYAPVGDVEGLSERVLDVLDNLAGAQTRVDRAEARIRAVTYAENARVFLELGRGEGDSSVPDQGSGAV